MSYEVETSFVEQFRDNVHFLAQQKGSKLMGRVRLEKVTGKSHYFERLGPTDAVLRTSRHGDTPLISTPHSRRKVSMQDWEWADLVDRQDDIRMLIDPANKYAMQAAWALGRRCDTIILEALRGNAFAGDSGQTTIPLPAAQRITDAGGLTKAKLIEARVRLLAADVDPDMTDLYIAYHPNQLSDLLNDNSLTSSDYNSVQALVSGTFGDNDFMGFKWVSTTRTLMKEGSATLRDVSCWAEDGIGVAVGQDIEVRISERPDKSYSKQVYASMTVGATRIEEEKVVIIECDES